MTTQRGLVVPLTPQQVVSRARYLAGELAATHLDEHVRQPTLECPVIHYELKGYNGGKDPTGPDPGVRWTKVTKEYPQGRKRISADCVGGAAWCSGFDRFQPQRFAHIYQGWINTDSMLQDARGPTKCFVDERRPAPGALIVCKSGTPGHRIGHVGVIVSVPAEWDPTYRECWAAIGVVDVAARGEWARANRRTTGLGWRGTGCGFLRSLMKP